ncbi:HlyD family efflux transporter periplasmic adaptor subunit [Paenibacillus zeisoli]|uniref:HlyD family efflux transporter periplasmic adaptor subunit n=2 Tax=Paenibacillus zeisoli TaxID=2496267 RepID=A0A3S1D781_9BACL|nr:HlyD family efflux transporter periplasmic adaptor subunit [Paenibacillus zeisoli]
MSSRAILVNILVIVVILAGAGAGIYYYNQNANYVKTDNAQVAGQPITISSPAAGKLIRWNAKVGQAYNAGERLGSVQSTAGAADITLPVSGTVVQQSGVQNALVAAGTPLGRAYDFDNLWITANIDETRINDIKAGQSVDVYIDAFPGTVISGKVDSIGLATAGTFSLLPTSNSNANYTKVAQVIPIVITVEGYKGLGIVPGMNASVRIHI